MEYKDFVNTLVKKIENKLNDKEMKVTLSSIVKSGDCKRDCILISRNDDEGSPAIYLDDYYEFYDKGADIDLIADDILNMYYESMRILPLNFRPYDDWDSVKDNVTCRIMNLAVNRQYLEDAVFLKYLDLAIVFYITTITHDKHIFGCKINNAMLKDWGIDIQQLYGIAKENTMRIFGISLHEIKEIYEDLSDGMQIKDEGLNSLLDDPDRTPMYILTNKIGSQGAVNIFMDDVLRSVSENLHDDLYIIPSSIHEVMIIPVNGKMTENEVNNIIREVNMNLLEPRDILSNHVYIYSAEKDKILKG